MTQSLSRRLLGSRYYYKNHDDDCEDRVYYDEGIRNEETTRLNDRIQMLDKKNGELALQLFHEQIKYNNLKGNIRARKSNNKRSSEFQEFDRTRKARQRLMATVGEVCFLNPEVMDQITPHLNEDTVQQLNNLPPKPQPKRQRKSKTPQVVVPSSSGAIPIPALPLIRDLSGK
jgi:hypothetical protein